MKDKVLQLFSDGKISIDGLLSAVSRGWMRFEDVYGSLLTCGSIEDVKYVKFKELSQECGRQITSGIDVDIGGNKKHFSLELEDQANISRLFQMTTMGATGVVFHADSEECSLYPSEWIEQIYFEMQRHISYHTTYHNLLKEYVTTLDDIREVCEVHYGRDLPEPFLSKLKDSEHSSNDQMLLMK